jgi:NAD(P)-dependent dehydrogenase (short-subunit alcohol dehydrogenase family)
MQKALANKIYVISGGATGIGAAVKQKLLARGDHVIVIDIKDADILADLSSADGRHQALEGIQRLAPEGLDGLIPCAGLGPHVKPAELITRVNFFGSIHLIQGLRPLLEKRKGCVVAISSNSASLPGYPAEYVKSLLAADEAEACKQVSTLDGQSAYGGSKYALTVWMRKQAPAFIRSGVRMNAVAPGITRSAMTDGVFQDPVWGEAIRQFNEMTPSGDMATPDMIADSILFLLDPASRFVCGSVLFVDGGTDALLRPVNF